MNVHQGESIPGHFKEIFNQGSLPHKYMRGERKTQAYTFISGYRMKDMDISSDSTGIGNPDLGLLGVESYPL